MSFAQNNISVEEVRNLYESFDYSKVVTKADSMILNDQQLTDNEKIDLFTMCGVSNYSLGNFEKARKSFISLLKIDDDYELDPAFISPKIITLFKNIKNDYHEITNNISNPDEQIEVPVDTEENSNPKLWEIYKERNSDLKGAFVKSMLFPGLGHLHMGEKTKGWILTIGNGALLGGLVYSFIETGKREDDYLNETDVNLLNEKYNSYNDMYKTRNILIGAYAVFWLYSQIDLFLFNDELPDSVLDLNVNNSLKKFDYNDFALSIRFNF